jgi:deoxyguanosine kinase
MCGVETPPRIVVVAGNIATGKTRLLDTLSDALSLPPFRERWEDNPWFNAKPDDTFASQMWFLLAAGADHARMTGTGGVQERCIHENALIFAGELLVGDELELLESVYAHLDEGLPDPMLLVHLHASPNELARRVDERGRVQERTVTIEYLERLSVRYRCWVDNWTRSPVIEVDTETIDVRTEQGVRHILARVSEELA